MDSKAGRPGSGGRGDAGAGGDRGGDAKRAAALAPSGTGAREARARPAGEVPDPAVPELACSELTAGLDLRKRGRLALAMSCFERAVAAAPQLADAWFWLAVTRDNLGLEAEAIAAYRAAAQARTPIEYHVFPLGCVGLGYEALKRRLADRLPMAVVHEELPFEAYIERLAGCDVFVCPFPYGNMNSIVDAVMVGLPGVCLDGPEAHAHADVAYFRRLGLPPELGTSSLNDYVAAIVRLVDDPDWLARCQAAARRVDRGHPFFGADDGLFVRAIHELISGR